MFLKGVDVVKPCKWNFEKPFKRREDTERKQVGSPVLALQRGEGGPDKDPHGLLGQAQLLSKQVRTMPVKGSENREMEDGRGKTEGGSSDVESHWCYSALFLNRLCSQATAAGKWAQARAAQDALAGSQALEKTYHGIVGELLELEKRAILNVFALLCSAAPRDFTIPTSTEPPACFCAALDPFLSFLRVRMPYQEGYGTVGKTTEILSFPLVSWQEPLSNSSYLTCAH